MTDKPLSQFGRRKPSAPSTGSPAASGKRSQEVVLLVMGTIAVGSTAFALMPRECTPAPPGTIPTLSSPSECPPRGSSSSGRSGMSAHYSYSSGGSSGSTAATTTDESSGIKRGGFGSYAHSFASHFSFGS